jgi:outer membrane protein insertion porin family
VLEANVEEKPTGELQLSAGYSSLEKLIFQGSVQQRNFRGRGQTVGLSLSYSQYSKSAEVSFTEPYLFDRNVSMGINVYRRDYNSFNYANADRNTLYQQTQTGLQMRIGLPLTEYVSAVASYTLNVDDITVDKNQYFTDRQNPPTFECDPLIAGRYLCDALGNRTSSILGLSLIYDTLDNRIPPIARAFDSRSPLNLPGWAARSNMPASAPMPRSIGRWARAGSSRCAARPARSSRSTTAPMRRWALTASA